MHILIVEDDDNEARAVSDLLVSLNHTTSIVNDGERALRFLKSEYVDAVILDWQLPAISGPQILRWIRENLGAERGVLFLTNRVLEVDLVSALRAGADDYVRKPFSKMELIARVDALLRRTRRPSETRTTIDVGEYALDQVGRTIALRGEVLELATKEFQIIALLFVNVGKIVSHDVLEISAWGRRLEPESRSLATHIYRLRQKLKLTPENGLRLTSIYTLGYRLEEAAPPGLQRGDGYSPKQRNCASTMAEGGLTNEPL